MFYKVTYFDGENKIHKEYKIGYPSDVVAMKNIGYKIVQSRTNLYLARMYVLGKHINALYGAKKRKKMKEKALKISFWYFYHKINKRIWAWSNKILIEGLKKD
ncbi:hypothetical protein [Veillonella sp.]|uniref:hypothetical protein n=1 Tax=Veillonella sp. TaxID=1926307 RepID=UPI0025D160A8|nr:hypothetical protein [Veillonella sp.]